MRHRHLFAAALFTALLLPTPRLTGQASAPAVIENPARPASKNPDRMVDLKEVLRIKDDGGDFYFKNPFCLRIGPGGTIFVQEQEQLLKFGADGKFLRNFFRKGQGPGEVRFISAFLPLDSGLIVQSSYPAKMIWYREDGSLLKEETMQGPARGMNVLGRASAVFVLASQGNPFESLNGTAPAVVDVPISLLTWKEGDRDLKPAAVFPVEMYVIRSAGGGGGMISISELITAPAGEGRLAVSHTQDYLIKIYDPEAKMLVRSFRRAYDRVKYDPPKNVGLIINGARYTSAPRKYESDVTAIHETGGRLWVVTSARDKSGNPSIDVFDFEGRYLDRFILRKPKGAGAFLSNRACVVRDGCLYQLETDPDETQSVTKYQIVDPDARR